MGIVYVLSNPAFDDYVKIGRTNNLDRRLRELDTTSVPLPFRCVYAVEVDDERISGVLKTNKNNDDGFEDHKIPNGECEVCGCNISSNLIFCSDCEEDFRQANSIETQSEALNTISDDLKINNPCIDCGCEIPQARIDNVAGVIRCAKCQSKFEESNPDIVARKTEETFGTREDFKNMSRRQFGINTKTKN